MKNKSCKSESSYPAIQILATRENPDGTMDVDIEYGKDWVELVKQDLNKKKVTKKDIEKHFLDLLKKGVERLEGYGIKKVKEPKNG